MHMWKLCDSAMFIFSDKIFKDFWFLTGSDTLMTFDLKIVATLKTPTDNNANVLTMLLCYVIC